MSSLSSLHAAPGVSPGPRHPQVLRQVVSCQLRSTRHSDANRQTARQLAWQWVSSRWPRLMPSLAQMEQARLEHRLPGQELALTASPDGSSWSLAIACKERQGNRTWWTQISVDDGGDADHVGLQTACSDTPDAPLVVAPPRLLGAWVERLALADGAVAVSTEPRHVGNPAQLDAFLDHLLSEQRRLPVIALANRSGTRFFGVDPRALATAVGGMAHVACVAPELDDAVVQRLGAQLGTVPGAARIYAPGLVAGESKSRHPLVRDQRTADSRERDSGGFRQLLRRKICALSVASGDAAGEPPSAGRRLA